MIRDEWIIRAIYTPIREYVQADGRIRRWCRVPEVENRYLRVILLPEGETVHNCFFDRGIRPMKIRYFEDTDTLLIEFREAPVSESRDLDEDTVLDLDAARNICSITVEHASTRADAPKFSFEKVAA
jgi:uncharacterized protein YuzE